MAVAGGTTVVGQRVLEAVFGDSAVRQLAERARRDLDERTAALLAGERARFTALLAGLAIATWLVLSPPRDERAAGWRLVLGVTVMFAFAPASRFGYIVYPLGLAAWLLLSSLPSLASGDGRLSLARAAAGGAPGGR